MTIAREISISISSYLQSLGSSIRFAIMDCPVLKDIYALLVEYDLINSMYKIVAVSIATGIIIYLLTKKYRQLKECYC